jgi:hypothetical protein
MTLHDAAMLRFGQWWNRSKRAGFAFAAGAALHGSLPERHWVRETRSALVWGIFLPLSVALLLLVASPWALLLAAIYPLQVLRLYLRFRNSLPMAGARAFFLVMGKFPEAMGVLKYFVGASRGVQAAIIEYK